MNRKCLVAAVVVCLCVLFACVTESRGQRVVRLGPAGHASAIGAPTLPYEGGGRVTILSDGTLLIEVEGEDAVAYDSDKGSEDELPCPGCGVFASQLDTTGLVLVQHGNDVFLDKQGKELARRGLSARQVFALSFPNAEQIDPASSPWSVAGFSGTLRLRLETSGEARVLSIELIDSDATGRVFTLMAPVSAGGAGSRGGPLLLGGGDYQSDSSSDCSVTCRNGTNSIHCNNAGCKCYCKAGNPTCECVSKLPWY